MQQLTPAEKAKILTVGAYYIDQYGSIWFADEASNVYINTPTNEYYVRFANGDELYYNNDGSHFQFTLNNGYEEWWNADSNGNTWGHDAFGNQWVLGCDGRIQDNQVTPQ